MCHSELMDVFANWKVVKKEEYYFDEITAQESMGLVPQEF